MNPNIPSHRLSGGDNMLPGQVDLKPLLHPLLDRAGRAPSSAFEVLEEKSWFRHLIAQQIY